MSTVTAVSWSSGGQSHSEVFAIGFDNTVFVSKDGGSFVPISAGGKAIAISAGLDSAGNPELYAIGTNNAVYVSDNGSGWVGLGGYAKAISASVKNTVFAIGSDDSGQMNRVGSGWTGLGGKVKAISAGLDSAGNPELYGIGTDNAVYVSDNGSGWISRLSGYATEISAAAMGMVFARGGDVGQVFVSRSSSALNYIGSIALANPASAAAYSPAPAGAPLFNNNQPSYLDVEQGVAADCWLDASLAEVADRAPQDIKNMFVYDGTTVDNGATVGLYSVRFFSPNGTGFYVQVDTALPSGGGYYNRVGNALGTQSLWAALAEKGYAEANALGLVTTGAEGQGSYASLNYGDPAWALQAITGQSASDYAINPTNIANAWNSGQLIVLVTSTPTSSFIVSSHCYAVVGYNASSSLPFEVFNPWGTQSNGWAPGNTGTKYGLFYANSTFISQNFTGQSIGTGATGVYGPADPADESIEPATLHHAMSKKFATVRSDDISDTADDGTRTTEGTATLRKLLS
jgi:hypothetical protein